MLHNFTPHFWLLFQDFLSQHFCFSLPFNYFLLWICGSDGLVTWVWKQFLCSVALKPFKILKQHFLLLLYLPVVSRVQIWLNWENVTKIHNWPVWALNNHPTFYAGPCFYIKWYGGILSAVCPAEATSLWEQVGPGLNRIVKLNPCKAEVAAVEQKALASFPFNYVKWPKCLLFHRGRERKAL